MEAIHVLAVSVAAAAMSLIAVNVYASSESATRDEAAATVGKGAQYIESSGSTTPWLAAGPAGTDIRAAPPATARRHVSPMEESS